MLRNIGEVEWHFSAFMDSFLRKHSYSVRRTHDVLSPAQSKPAPVIFLKHRMLLVSKKQPQKKATEAGVFAACLMTLIFSSVPSRGGGLEGDGGGGLDPGSGGCLFLQPKKVEIIIKMMHNSINKLSASLEWSSSSLRPVYTSPTAHHSSTPPPSPELSNLLMICDNANTTNTCGWTESRATSGTRAVPRCGCECEKRLNSDSNGSTNVLWGSPVFGWRHAHETTASGYMDDLNGLVPHRHALSRGLSGKSSPRFSAAAEQTSSTHSISLSEWHLDTGVHLVVCRSMYSSCQRLLGYVFFFCGVQVTAWITAWCLPAQGMTMTLTKTNCTTRREASSPKWPPTSWGRGSSSTWGWVHATASCQHVGSNRNRHLMHQCPTHNITRMLWTVAPSPTSHSLVQVVRYAPYWNFNTDGIQGYIALLRIF